MTKAQFLKKLEEKIERAEFDTENDRAPGAPYWDAYADALDSVYKLAHYLDGAE